MKSLLLCQLRKTRQHRLSQGYTLFEVLVVVVIIGILAAIALPSWQKYIANREVTSARDKIRQGVLQAQHAAITHRSSWRFSIRAVDDHLEWTTHANDVSWQEVDVWHPLHPNVIFYDDDTTLVSSGGTYYVKFGFKGEVLYRLGTVTVDSKNGIAQNKCVIISTLIGKTRKGKEHSFPKGERYCY